MTAPRMIRGGMTAIATGAVATSSDRATAEINSPTAVPAVASAASVSHSQAGRPRRAAPRPDDREEQECLGPLIRAGQSVAAAGPPGG